MSNPATTRQTFLVEHYRPGSVAVELEQAAASVRGAVRELEVEGYSVRYRHSTVVGTDESLLCVIEAASEALVRLAFARANVPIERISVAVTER